jgi:hypothetical protein
MEDDEFPLPSRPQHRAGPLPSPGELLKLAGLNPKVRVVSRILNPEEWEAIRREQESLPDVNPEESEGPPGPQMKLPRSSTSLSTTGAVLSATGRRRRPPGGTRH